MWSSVGVLRQGALGALAFSVVAVAVTSSTPCAAAPPVALVGVDLAPLGPHTLYPGGTAFTWNGARARPFAILDASGRTLTTLHAASHESAAAWDGRDAAGQAAPAGDAFVVGAAPESRVALRSFHGTSRATNVTFTLSAVAR
ncbi:MAG TPA: hypothetical protein VL332_09440 [Candidatus Saccharimonadaceae bacterium]|jgi:hypothetical protein|nr:hypothetical protein [Candidatus Saccharimonadaceae bacterium]